ncbi:DUF4232 domain-containing protein [Pseudonocardia hydrocarbonoxydans]|nr:DUF4232 domain-containing protein [Pseudonocardia hydrocarbonoxydans]
MIVKRTAVLAPLLLLALAGCGSADRSPDPAAASGTPSAPTSASTSTARATADATQAARCVAADLRVALGEATGEGQRTVPVVYTNVSDRACEATGVPGVDLRGPEDPNGPSYSVVRQEPDGTTVTLEPGAAAVAVLTYLTDSPGSVGTLGSTGWVPTELVTTPPGDTAQLTVPWNGDPVLRQDGATRPGTYVGPLAGS